MLGAAVNAAIPRIQTTIEAFGTSEYTLLWQIDNTTVGLPPIRFYASGGALIVTSNASYDPVALQWSRDVSGGSTFFRVTGTAIQLYTRSSLDASPWSFGGWDRGFVVEDNTVSGIRGINCRVDGRFRFNGTMDGYRSPQSTKPTGTATFSVVDDVNPRCIYNSNIVKAWGRIRSDGSGFPNGIILLDGFHNNFLNINGVGGATVGFESVMANGNYAVLFSSGRGTTGTYMSENESTTGFTITPDVTLTSNVREFSFVVVGRD
jgi:hypothetical protein